VSLLVVSACGTDRVRITAVAADSPDATVLLLSLDICHPSLDEVPTGDVTESDAEVRVRLSSERSGGDEDDCVGSMLLTLVAPIGDRVVVDDRSGERFVVTFTGAPSASDP
jgi:hypothetical protein